MLVLRTLYICTLEKYLLSPRLAIPMLQIAIKHQKVSLFYPYSMKTAVFSLDDCHFPS